MCVSHTIWDADVARGSGHRRAHLLSYTTDATLWLLDGPTRSNHFSNDGCPLEAFRLLYIHGPRCCVHQYRPPVMRSGKPRVSSHQLSPGIAAPRSCRRISPEDAKQAASASAEGSAPPMQCLHTRQLVS